MSISTELPWPDRIRKSSEGQRREYHVSINICMPMFNLIQTSRAYINIVVICLAIAKVKICIMRTCFAGELSALTLNSWRDDYTCLNFVPTFGFCIQL